MIDLLDIGIAAIVCTIWFLYQWKWRPQYRNVTHAAFAGMLMILGVLALVIVFRRYR
jgi:xanthine/uracil/vitamin C permease (AzgA family)